ncbi:MAG: redoxin domain-containing protein [Bacillota bacterium]
MKRYYIIFIFIFLIFLFNITYSSVIIGEEPQENKNSLKIWSITETSNSSEPVTGNKAPGFTYKKEDEEKIRLSDLEGKIVFLNFWASWCPPCKEEMPDIQNIYEKYKDQKNVKILTVNLQEEDNTVTNYLNNNELNFPVLMDEGTLAQSYYVSSIPTSFFIDQEGIIQKIQKGAMTEKMIEKNIREIDNSSS